MYMLDNLYWRLYNAVTKKIAEEEGINTIEIVFILAALVALALLFRNQIMSLFTTLWAQITTDVTGP